MPIEIYSPRIFGLSVRCMSSDATGGTGGIFNQDDQELISIYTNPVENTIKFSHLSENIQSIYIIDSKGKETKILHVSGHSIDLKSFEKGPYPLRIHQDKGISNKTFIKH